MEKSVMESEVRMKSCRKRKEKEVALYGNYKFYYGYRVGGDVADDPRLKVLKREWFENKDCLDIGCNSGLVTINIAKKFNCRSILGIDIDASRIQDAYWNLKKVVRKGSTGKSCSQTSGVGCTASCKEANVTIPLMNGCKFDSSSDHTLPKKERDIRGVVTFQQENFVQSLSTHKKQYHAIVCFSVTKWIHLNWGDDGLITLFAKAWTLLLEGGVFILEPQPWPSYMKNYHVSEEATMNYKNIMLYPKYFQEILLDKIGFVKLDVILLKSRDCKEGFDRPIFVLTR